MNRLIPLLLAAASTLAVSACAYNSPGQKLSEQTSAAQALNRGLNQGESVGDLHEAQLAGARGDWAVSAALAEQSYREHPDIWNEFNLATAYQHTGRSSQAVPLYLDLVNRGKFTSIAPIRNFDGTLPAPLAASVSEEASVRLARMAGTYARLAGTDSGYPRLASSGYPRLASR